MTMTATRDQHGFTSCENCGRRFKERHSCQARRVYMPRRPEGFADLVEQAKQETRAEAVAGAQLTIDDLARACVECGPTEMHVDEDSGRCASCMARAAREQAERIRDWHALTGRASRPPP